ncbi:hypothetical protein Tcan_10021 [Toxocara canis]|uniref:Uncharacterized protein n=1 Tax=Toxocara canis TaxID=6265 RepID=A0A0B2W3N0_TOXCA|nr:hypothetical protein Tcan_10021 [Toxocara canis]
MGLDYLWSHGVAVSTQDFESCDPSSNLGGTSNFFARLSVQTNAAEVRKCTHSWKTLAVRTSIFACKNRILYKRLIMVRKSERMRGHFLSGESGSYRNLQGVPRDRDNMRFSRLFYLRKINSRNTGRFQK